MEADSGDGRGRGDCSSGEASWPSSDTADVSSTSLSFWVFGKLLSRFNFKSHELELCSGPAYIFIVALFNVAIGEAEILDIVV